MTAVMLGDIVEVDDPEYVGVRAQVWQVFEGAAMVATGDEYLKVRESHLKVVERILPEPKGPTDRTARLVKARKHDACGCPQPDANGHECLGIKRGQTYVRAVMFPGANSSSKRPEVLKLCLICARLWNDTDPARLVVKS